MTLSELFDNPYFILLPARQKLLAVGLLALAEDGECVGDPIFLKNVVLSMEADTIPTEEIETDLDAVRKALPLEVFIAEDGERFYRWLV